MRVSEPTLQPKKSKPGRRPSPVERVFDKMRPLFSPGAKLGALFPLFEAIEAFMLTSPEVTPGPPHARDALDLKRVMITVVIALVPCTLLGIFNAGYQYNNVNQIADATFVSHWLEGARIVIPIIFVSYLVGGLWEVFFCIVRKHEVSEGFLVTGLLFPLTLPPTIPLWQVALGISFGTVIGKEIFGGTGYNIVNPALVSRAFLFFAYPASITGDAIWTAVSDRAETVAGFTGATPLAVAANVPEGMGVVEALHNAGFSLRSMIVGLEAGSIGETSLIAILIGAAILLVTGIGSWRIMTACFVGLLATSKAFNALPGDIAQIARLPFSYHIAMGGFAFAAVFMATDPVSAAATNAGKWIYGFLIGFLTIVIRVANPAFREGAMLAVLFMNVMAPLVDHVVLQTHIRRRTRMIGARSHG